MGDAMPSGTRAVTVDGDAMWRPGDLTAEIRDVMAHLRARRRWVVVLTLLAGLAGAGLAAAMPRLYTATAQITVDPVGLRVFDKPVVQGGQLPDAQSAIVETQSRILTSDAVLKPVVEQQRLGEDPEFDGSPRGPLGAAFKALRRLLPGAAPDDPNAIALANLNEAVKVQRDAGSFVLELSVRSLDPAKAARLAQAIADTFIASQEQVRQDAAARVTNGLAQRLDDLSAEVNRAEKAVDDYKRDNRIVGANGRLVTDQQLGDLTNQQTAAQVRVADLKARYEQIQKIQRAGVVPDATAEVVNSATIAALRARFAEARQSEQYLLTSLGPRHPSLLAARAQLEAIRILIADEVARIAAAAKADYDRARTSQGSLSHAVEAATRETGSVSTAEIHLRELEREAQARRVVYEAFLTRARETREQSDLPVDNIRIITPPALPMKRGGLPAVLVVLIAALFGASAASVAVLVADRLRGRLVTPRQFGLSTALPLIGPAVPPAGDAAARRLSALADDIGDLAPGQAPRIVLFLSASARAAEAWLPAELAGALCAHGRRVLLIDADADLMTRPLETETEGRFGNRHLGVRATGVAGLSVLSARAAVVRTLGNEDGAFARLAAGYDMVLLHAGAARGLPRARLLAAQADVVVLLVAARDASVAAVDALRAEIGPHAGKAGGFVWIGGPPAPLPAASAPRRGVSAPTRFASTERFDAA